MDCYTFSAPIKGEQYRELLEFGCVTSSRASLVVRDPDIDAGASIDAILATLRPFEVSKDQVREWPGTQLLRGTAVLYSYATSAGLCSLLGSLRPGLLDWIHPEAPEDLCFVRETGEPILVSISHENDSYLLLTESEKELLDKRFPDLSRMLVLE